MWVPYEHNVKNNDANSFCFLYMSRDYLPLSMTHLGLQMHSLTIVKSETEVKHWEEAASRIERIRRQPADIVTGAAQKRIPATN